MRSRYDVSLNNIPLSSISPKILITDVRHKAPGIQDTNITVAKRQGSRVTRRYVGTASVTVMFMIYEYSSRKRQAICNDVARWAKSGGILKTSERDGQYLKCECSEPPVIKSAVKWADVLSMTFTANEIPFWQEEFPASITLTGTSATGNLYVPGSADGALVEVSAKLNSSMSDGTLTLGVNGRTLTLSGLTLSANSVITISYDAQAIQSIRTGTTSLMNKRTGVDDLLANGGENNAFSLSASASVSATFTVRGIWT